MRCTKQSTKNNQTDIAPKLSNEGEQSFFYVTRRLNLIYIVIMFYADIPDSYLVLANLRIALETILVDFLKGLRIRKNYLIFIV